jgi:hypothetical protein
MNRQETLKKIEGALLCRLERGIAYALVLVLTVTSLSSPAKATWPNYSGKLPGIASKGPIIGVAAAGAAAVGLLVYFKVRHKGHHGLKRQAQTVRFGDLTPGAPAKKDVPVTNKMSEAVTVNALTVQDPSLGKLVPTKQ